MLKFNVVFSYIIKNCIKNNIPLDRGRLLCLAYLLDLDNYEEKQEMLTDAIWFFDGYTPYPKNYKDYIDKILNKEIH